jgi:hypothetical protein
MKGFVRSSVVLISFATAASAAISPTLSGLTPAGDGFQLSLAGENNVPYIIEASTDLQSWFPIATNLNIGATRTISVNGFGPNCTYRATARPPLFRFAIAALDAIDMNGNDLLVDSFDSSNPMYSTSGRYDVAKRRDNGDTAAIRGLTNSVNVGSATIYGHLLRTGDGSAMIGPNGSVGDLSWHTAGVMGFQPGSLRDDLRMDYSQVAAPWPGGASTPAGGQYGGVAYDYVVGTGNWQMNMLNLFSTKKVAVIGDASLYVFGDFTISGSAYIRIMPGANLRLFVGGPSMDIRGNGVINENDASHFVVYGLPTTTSASIGANSSFSGCIYAPNAYLQLNGSSTEEYHISGAFVSRSTRVNGHLNFHYDEAVRRIY